MDAKLDKTVRKRNTPKSHYFVQFFKNFSPAFLKKYFLFGFEINYTQ